MLPKRPIARLGILLVGAPVAFFATPSSLAQAWSSIGCKFAGSQQDIYVTVNDSPTTDLTASAQTWEVGTTGFFFDKTTVLADREVYANNKDFGNTGWSGLTHDSADLVNPPTCNSGHYDKTKITVSVNNFYNGTSPGRRNGVAVHEFGHYVGLAHNNTTLGFCSGGGNIYQSIMYYSDARFVGNCGIFVPQSDDEDGANALH